MSDRYVIAKNVIVVPANEARSRFGVGSQLAVQRLPNRFSLVRLPTFVIRA
jgi:hypothetical protein